MKRSALMVTIVPLAGIAYLVYTYGHPPWTALRITGLALMFPAIAFVIVARIQLGDSFTLSPQAKQLVVRGIYSRIRNPIYVFSAIVLAGLILFLEKPYFFLVLAPLLVMQFFRARAEARVLEERFGEEYRAYKARTWF
jgi:protein-S-isoprenylcysteine O-methyltransferase Ste14